jgi:ABC-type nickel/cobalt efflux system permease component RcnA
MSRLAPVLFFAAFSHPVSAHNPPEEYYDRRVAVELEPACVRVRVHVELSQVSLFSLPDADKKIDVSQVKNRKTLEAAVLKRFQDLLPDEILVFIDGRLLPWEIENARVDPLDSSHFHLWLRADWKPTAGEHRLELSDKSFNGVPGPYRMTFDAKEGVEVESFDVPSAYLIKSRAIDPRDERLLKVEFRVAPEFLEALPSSPPAMPEPAPASFWQRLWNDDLTFLLTKEYGIGLLLLIAFVHGAGHSIMPGHGKTMVAAYLVGERGTPAHAVLLGAVTTLTHTSAAIGVALLLRYVLPPHSEAGVNMVLMFSCGLTMIFVGLWLFLQRLAGRSDHVHLFDVGHGHAHGETPAVARSSQSAVRLVLLGVAGGIIPCWGAIMWVVGCVATNQFWLALPVVLAFSVGLAVVLILIGLSVVYAGRLGQTRLGQARWFRKVFNERTVRIMPIVGAGVIVLLGLFFCATSGIASR